MVFRSKVDTWLVLLALGGPVAALALVLFTCSRTANVVPPLLIALVVVSILVGFVGWTFASTNYSVRGDLLIIRSGPFRWKVAIKSIESITPTSNPLSSPALSMDRLDIRYAGGKEILVSPEDKAGFIAVLSSRNPLIRTA